MGGFSAFAKITSDSATGAGLMESGAEITFTSAGRRLSSGVTDANLEK